MSQNYSLNDINKKESLVLADTGVLINSGDWYRDGVYPADSFSEIDKECLDRCESAVEEGLDFMGSEKVMTIEAVVKEVKKILDLVNDKYWYLDGCSRRYYKRGVFLKNDYEADLDIESRKSRDRLRRIGNKFFNLWKTCSDSSYSPSESDIFKLINTTVYDVSNIEGILKSGPDEKRGASLADELLVATAIYISIAEKRSLGLVTTDGHLPLIMTKAYSSFRETEKGREIIDMMAAWPLALYYYDKSIEQFIRVFDTSDAGGKKKIVDISNVAVCCAEEGAEEILRKIA